MNNIEKIKEMMKNDPELRDKLQAEAKRIEGSGDNKDEKTVLAQAVKTVFDIDLTEEEITKLLDEDPEELDLDDLEAASGGYSLEEFGTDVGVGFLKGVDAIFTGVARGICAVSSHKWNYLSSPNNGTVWYHRCQCADCGKIAYFKNDGSSFTEVSEAEFNSLGPEFH